MDVDVDKMDVCCSNIWILLIKKMMYVLMDAMNGWMDYKACEQINCLDHLSLLAYLSLSMSSRTSPTLTGPLTFLMRCLLSASLPVIRITLTWVIPPLEPVLPNSCVTLALTGSESMMI